MTTPLTKNKKMVNKTRILAIIPARSGSKRVPKKNIKDFLGKPLLSYPVEVCIKSGLFSDVMVSTDSIEVANIAKSFGASVPFLRSDEAANDFAPMNLVIKEVLQQYDKLGISFDYVFCIYPAAVTLTKKWLEGALDMLSNSKATSLISVVRFSYPIQRSLKMKESRLSLNFSESFHKRSQDLEPTYHDAGQFYLAKSEHFHKSYRFLTDEALGMELPESEVQDIDTIEDWKIAELKYQMHRASKGKVNNEV